MCLATLASVSTHEHPRFQIVMVAIFCPVGAVRTPVLSAHCLKFVGSPTSLTYEETSGDPVEEKAGS